MRTPAPVLRPTQCRCRNCRPSPGWVPFKRVVIAIILAPYAITEVTTVVMWRYMLEPDVAALVEVMDTLKALGLWKGSA